jgi:hypothetical protein
MESSNHLNSNSIDSKFIDFEFIRNSVKFEKDTLFPLYLKDVFDDLSSREPNQKGISKFTFSEYVKLPVFISEKLFSSLDKDSKGYINEKEFTQGFTKLYLGNFLETAEMIFKIMDFDKDGLITRGDVKVLLSYLPLKASESKEMIAEYKHQMKSLEELDEILTSTFGSISKNSPEPSLSLEKFIDIITKSHSDIYIHLLCFLYQNKPFQIEKVNSYKLHKSTSSTLKKNINKPTINTLAQNSPNKMSIPSPKKGSMISTQSYIEHVNFQIRRDSEKRKSSASNSPSRSPGKTINRSSTIINPPKSRFSAKNINTIKDKENSSSKNNSPEIHARKLSKNNINQGEMIRMSNQKVLPGNKSSDTEGSTLNLNNLLQTSKNFYNSPSHYFKGKTSSDMPEFSLEDNLKSLPENDSDVNSDSSHGSIQSEDIRCEDYIFMPQPDKSLKKLYMVLIGKEIILYTDHKKDDKVIFQNLSGCFIKDYTETYTSKDKTKYYQFKIVVSKNLSRHILVSSEDAKNNWVGNLKIAIGYQNFLDYYTLQEDIDEGRFGKVKLGVHKSTGEKVAIKVIKKDDMNESELEMLKSELDLMKLFRHPNIVRLLDHFENDTYMYIVMEYLSGGNIRNYLNKMNLKITEKQAGKIIYAVAQGIKYMNSFGIIHRDLKPDNIMFTDSSQNSGIKIIDFGLTKTLAPNEKVSEGMGTITYVAPEVISRKPYNKEVDVWSLGVILYQLLSGNGDLPFDDPSDNEETIGKKIVFLDHSYPKDMFVGVSREAIRLIDACLNKKPEKRISIEDLLKDDWVKSNYK